MTTPSQPATLPTSVLFAWSAWTQIDYSLGGLLVSFLATQRQLDRLGDSKWYDERLDRGTNKARMKALGSAAIGYRNFLMTSSILGLAKSVEDLLYAMGKDVGKDISFWKIADRLAEGQFVKEIRSLANVMKHNSSFVSSSESDSAKYLVSQCGYPDNASLEDSIRSQSGAFDIPKSVFKMYTFLTALVEDQLGVSHPLLQQSEPERSRYLRNHLVPDVLGL